MDNEQEEKPRTFGDYFDGVIALLIKCLGIIFSFLGFPGVVVCIIWYFIEQHATLEQKRQIINRYILFEDAKPPFIVHYVSWLFFLVIILIQHKYWKKNHKIQKERIDELNRTNEKLQNRLIKQKKGSK